MQTTLKIIAALLVSFTAVTVKADPAQLKINGDLMIHPDQIATFFSLATKQIQTSAGWNWPELDFTKPYHTSWSNVQAHGPFDISFDTSALNSQVLGVELNWNDPAISIGQFQIDDTITRNVGGNTIVIHLSGMCSGLSASVPNGQWKVKGHLTWAWVNGALQVSWSDFSFSMNSSATPVADFGQCSGPSGLQPALSQAFNDILHDSSWLQDVLHDGVLDWVQNAMGTLQGELLKPRTLTLKTGLDLTWQPEMISGLDQGRVRVAGHFDLVKAGASVAPVLLDRSYDPASLSTVTESGFVLPHEALPTLISFIYQTGDLQYRVTSDKIDSFVALMQSRFLQFFVWPDLMNFAKDSVFYFDVATTKAPQLSQGRTLSGGGIAYNMQAPLIVHQWAPSKNQYLPYIDFASAMSGVVQASVKNGQMNVQMTPSSLNIQSDFRSEFSRVRSVNSWIATSLLGSRVQGYLSTTPMGFTIPQWDLGQNLELSIRDVQIWKQSLRVPLTLKNSK
jgi:hypothetical protein